MGAERVNSQQSLHAEKGGDAGISINYFDTRSYGSKSEERDQIQRLGKA